MNNSIKKQSIPQVCTWGMGFLDTPINKMGVTEFESMHSHLKDADLPLRRLSALRCGWRIMQRSWLKRSATLMGR